MALEEPGSFMAERIHGNYFGLVAPCLLRPEVERRMCILEAGLEIARQVPSSYSDSIIDRVTSTVGSNCIAPRDGL